MPPIREFEIFCGDCRDILPTLPRLADACICDPPYGLKFMGKGWDHGVPGVPYWKAVLNACKPGAHLLAFGGTRTFHRLTCAIEDAGWEIRDCIMWVYGSGFPKSLDVSKAIDKAAGVEREVVGIKRGTTAAPETGRHDMPGKATGVPQVGCDVPITAPATALAAKWDGWGTALKPAWEPIILARKPLSGTVAQNVLEYGTGALNIDGCRVGTEGGTRKSGPPSYKSGNALHGSLDGSLNGGGCESIDAGRFPANLLHDGSEEVLELMPETKSGTAIRHNSGGNTFGGENPKPLLDDMGYGDSGSAARFFYCAKASKKDRDEGCEGLDERPAIDNPNGNMGANMGSRSGPRRNNHPTVKPTSLMRYLCRLITPPGGVVLDPFMGSGSTGKAAILEARQFLGIELQPEYVQIATARLSHAVKLHQESSAQQNLL